MANHYTYVIIGAGIAGTVAAETLRNLDPTASITLIGAEPTNLYSRVKLPHFIKGQASQAQLELRQTKDYQVKQLTTFFGTTVTSLNRAARQLTLSNGQQLSYQKLLFATGGQPARLPLTGSDLPGVYTFRTLEDAKLIKRALKKKPTISIVGHSFIALEFLGLSLAKQLPANLIYPRTHLFSDSISPKAGIPLMTWLESQGIRCFPDTRITALNGKKRLESVTVSTGEMLPTTFLGVGIGLRLETEVAKQSGLTIGKGICTNSLMQTSDPHIYAAGDVAEINSPFDEVTTFHGNWTHAVASARLAATAMAGITAGAFRETGHYTATGLPFPLSIIGRPDPQGTTITEATTLSSGQPSIVEVSLHNNRLVGAAVINKPALVMPLKKALEEKILFNLSDPTISSLLNHPFFTSRSGATD